MFSVTWVRLQSDLVEGPRLRAAPALEGDSSKSSLATSGVDATRFSVEPGTPPATARAAASMGLAHAGVGVARRGMRQSVAQRLAALGQSPPLLGRLGHSTDEIARRLTTGTRRRASVLMHICMAQGTDARSVGSCCCCRAVVLKTCCDSIDLCGVLTPRMVAEPRC